MFIELSSCSLYPNMVIQSYIIMWTEIKYTKNVNNDLNQNANMKKQARFAKFAVSIVV